MVVPVDEISRKAELIALLCTLLVLQSTDISTDISFSTFVGSCPPAQLLDQTQVILLWISTCLIPEISDQVVRGLANQIRSAIGQGDDSHSPHLMFYFQRAIHDDPATLLMCLFRSASSTVQDVLRSSLPRPDYSHCPTSYIVHIASADKW
jgi:hypothetical protein